MLLTIFDNIQQTKGSSMTSPSNNTGAQDQQFWSTVAQYIMAQSSSNSYSSSGISSPHPPRTFPTGIPLGKSDIPTTEDLLIWALRANQANGGVAYPSTTGNPPPLQSPNAVGPTRTTIDETGLLALLRQAQFRSQTNQKSNTAGSPQGSFEETLLAIDRARRMSAFLATQQTTMNVGGGEKIGSHVSQVGSAHNVTMAHPPLPQGCGTASTSVCSAQSTETNTSTTDKCTTPVVHGTMDKAQTNLALNCSVDDQLLSVEARKKLKRAANRISAQQSRKRKHLFIEELKEENEELRKMCRVLSMLPDLIVTFDSAGIISFVSHVAEKVFKSTPDHLVGTSFWNLICHKSTRRLKAAFMDAMAASREISNSPSVSLVGGTTSAIKPMQIRISKDNKKQRDGSPEWVSYTLYGVVHLEGNTAECVCTIRRAEDDELKLEEEEDDDDDV